MSELGRICERRKLREKSVRVKILGDPGIVIGRMHVILKGQPFEEVDCFKYQLGVAGSS